MARREVSVESARAGILLCADDFAMTNGISRAIVELAEADRLSATSAMTTTTHWPSHATWLARVRGRISTGLHLNLTLGAPLGAMPRLAPDRRFPTVGQLTWLAYRRRLDRDEIAAEFTRQIAAFEREMAFPPDHIDGHQHVHALPVISDVLLSVLAKRYPAGSRRPLLRAPADRAFRVVRRSAVMKATALAWMTRRFAGKAAAQGFPTNDGFSGITGFAPARVAADLKAACSVVGPRHLVMCHPGFVDDELVRIDSVRERRRQEFDALMAGSFPGAIWHPDRTAAGDPIDWAAAWAGTE